MAMNYQVGDHVSVRAIVEQIDENVVTLCSGSAVFRVKSEAIVDVLPRPLKFGDEVRPKDSASVGNRPLVIRLIENEQAVCWNINSRSLEIWNVNALERRPAVKKVLAGLSHPPGWFCATPGQKP